MKEGWLDISIGEACVLRSGTTLPPQIEKSSGEIPYLKVADMNIPDNKDSIICSSRYVNTGDVNASHIFPVGTTVFPKRGGAILTNKKRLTTLPICADLNIMGVTPKQGLLPEFLFYYFLRLDLREINNGSSIPQINNYNIEPLPISFPGCRLRRLRWAYQHHRLQAGSGWLRLSDGSIIPSIICIC